jgi:hypothetical protein
MTVANKEQNIRPMTTKELKKKKNWVANMKPQLSLLADKEFFLDRKLG